MNRRKYPPKLPDQVVQAERNIPFYERFGFERVRTIEIGGHPPVYPMLRRPR